MTHRRGGPRVAGWWADARAAAVAEALAPFAWRDFTDRMLAGGAGGGVARCVVLCCVSSTRGATPGGVGPVDPAAPGDPRVALLGGGLAVRQGRDFSLDRL